MSCIAIDLHSDCFTAARRKNGDERSVKTVETYHLKTLEIAEDIIMVGVGVSQVSKGTQAIQKLATSGEYGAALSAGVDFAKDAIDTVSHGKDLYNETQD